MVRCWLIEGRTVNYNPLPDGHRKAIQTSCEDNRDLSHLGSLLRTVLALLIRKKFLANRTGMSVLFKRVLVPDYSQTTQYRTIVVFF